MPSRLRSERNRLILAALAEHGTVAIRDIAGKLDVSEMTLRRDLADLESQGLARRVHGGAVLASDRDPGYWLRHKRNQAEKRLIGALAASMVENGQIVYIDTGTTNLEVARSILRRSLEANLQVRVVTHAVNVAAELAGHRGVVVHMIGGEVFPETLGTTGPQALRYIRSLNFDLFFLGVTGGEVAGGWTNNSPVGVDLKQVVLERTSKSYVVADASKWGRRGFLRVAPIDGVDGWITDRSLPAAVRRALSAKGLDVRIATQRGTRTSPGRKNGRKS